MAIVLCPQCNRRVQLTAESLCPGCRSKISEAGTVVAPTPLDSVPDAPKLPERIEPIEDNSNEKTPASASLSSVVERKVDRAHKMARLSWMMPFILLGLNALVAMMAPGKYQHMAAVLRMGMMARDWAGHRSPRQITLLKDRDHGSIDPRSAAESRTRPDPNNHLHWNP